MVKGSEQNGIKQYVHDDQKRVNNPPVGLVTAETDRLDGKRKYHFDPHLDPQLQWAGKTEGTSFDVDTVSLHVHERIDPLTIIEAVRRRELQEQQSLFHYFETKENNPPIREAIEFYKHSQGWSNRLIAGDSLLVMNSLLEKEGMAGKVQMIYIDPPYGIRYGSNFQPFINKRDVKDGKDEDLTQEPEMIRAFRDTWELGIHSYLTYLRDRLLLVHELLHETGSCFLQISDENLHHVREVLDEIFGKRNFCSIISFVKSSGLGAVLLPRQTDYLVWYAKDIERVKYRQLYRTKALDVGGASAYTFVLLPDGETRRLTQEERESPANLPQGSRVFRYGDLTKPGPGSKYGVRIGDRTFTSGNRWWGIPEESMYRLIEKGRVAIRGPSLSYIRYLDDFPAYPITNAWGDTGTGSGLGKIFVVQTDTRVVERCVLMTTDPGDLVLDPTCGSGTTAYVAEEWGRRWITCDTSRVAITLAKQRLMTAVHDYYELAHPKEGVASGFRFRTLPHITLKSIANEEPPAQETLYNQPIEDKSKKRVTGPFTIEAVPSQRVRSLEEVEKSSHEADISISRSGETLRQDEWISEMLSTGIRGKGGQVLEFARIEPLGGTRWIHAEAETKDGKKIVIFWT